jgi:hypothetical protein
VVHPVGRGSTFAGLADMGGTATGNRQQRGE